MKLWMVVEAGREFHGVLVDDILENEVDKLGQYLAGNMALARKIASRGDASHIEMSSPETADGFDIGYRLDRLPPQRRPIIAPKWGTQLDWAYEIQADKVLLIDSLGGYAILPVPHWAEVEELL